MALNPKDFTTLLLEERDDRLTVLLNRPEVRNAIDIPLRLVSLAACAMSGVGRGFASVASVGGTGLLPVWSGALGSAASVLCLAGASGGRAA